MYTYKIETEITGQYCKALRLDTLLFSSCLRYQNSRLPKIPVPCFGEPLHDKRGSHGNQKLKLTEEVKQLIHTHCASLPHTETHYSSNQTKLHYFENPELTLTRLYESFVNFYKAETGNCTTPIEQNTYSEYFNHYVNFTFKVPTTDVCNFCYENEDFPEKSQEFLEHIIFWSVDDYRKMKSSMIPKKEFLCCEFDYGQNLPLPKIAVSDQFYRKLIWLHNCNIHVHNSPRSYMFPYMEGYYKKGADTVYNLLLHVITEETKIDCVNRILLFSDACGGQNRNYSMMICLSLLSRYLEVAIKHLYPVRGHSYCQCDRNFGAYGKLKKKVECVETESEWINIIKRARKTDPFIVVEKHQYDVKDLETIIKQGAKVPKELQISKAVKIEYFPDGTVKTYDKYYGGKIFEVKIETSLTISDIQKAPLVPPVVISVEKKKDSESLLRYLSRGGQEFFKHFLDKVALKKK